MVYTPAQAPRRSAGAGLTVASQDLALVQLRLKHGGPCAGGKVRALGSSPGYSVSQRKGWATFLLTAQNQSLGAPSEGGGRAVLPCAAKMGTGPSSIEMID